MSGSSDLAEALGPLVEALSRLDDRYTKLKRADALLDFSDLEREGLALLRSDAGAAIAADFDHLLVDEYQDTSRIQEAISKFRARSGEAAAPSDPAHGH